MKRIETQVLFRPSGLGQIMTNPIGKSNKEKYHESKKALENELEKIKGYSEKAIKSRENSEAKCEKLRKEIAELEKIKDEVKLSATCKKFLQTMAIKIRYNREKRLNNKYVKKGIEVEQASIELYSEWSGEHLENNKIRKQNAFFTGEYDLKRTDKTGKIAKMITDIKSRYDIDSFEDNRDEDAKDRDKYQLQAYCDLEDAESASIANCLTNNDFGLILQEIRSEFYRTKPSEQGDDFEIPLWRAIEIAKDNIFDKESFDKFLIEYCPMEFQSLRGGCNEDELAQNMFNSFVEVELEDRVIETIVPRDNDLIELIKVRIRECRKYLADKYNIHHIEPNEN